MTYELNFSSAKRYTNSKYSFDYYELDNFAKENNNNKIYMPGKYFLIGTDEFLWHYISEALTQYELLLKEIPDLKLIFFNMSPWMPDVKKELLSDFVKKIKYYDKHLRLSYFEDTARIYLKESFDTEYIYSYNQYDFILEKAYIIFDLRHIISKKAFTNKKMTNPYYLNFKTEIHQQKKYSICDHAPWSSLNNIKASWQKHGMKLIRERFYNFLSLSNKLPKKIYIDRSDANAKWQYFLKKEGTTLAEPEISMRIFEKEYLIREYFKKNGYVPIVMSNYKYIDQLNFYYNATHIAGLCGTGMLGGFVSQKNTNIIELYVNKGYNFSYSYLTEIAPVNVISIDLRNEKEEFSSKSFDILDKYKEAGFFGRE